MKFAKIFDTQNQYHRQFSIILLIISMWFVMRPYSGIIHDARFYAAQAINYVTDRSLNSDLFFQFGSQDSYSIFSRIYGPLIKAVGLGWSNLIFWACGLILSLYSIVFLGRQLFKSGKEYLYAIIGAVVLSTTYGWGVLSYSENFVTPRLFAEALSVIALAFLLGGRYIYSVFFILLSAIIHPLTTAPIGILLFLVCPVSLSRKILFAFLVAAVFTCLGLLNVDPFSRLVTIIDEEWFGIIRERSPHAIISRWPVYTFFYSWLAVVGFAYLTIYGKPREKIISIYFIAYAMSIVFVSFLMVDVFHNLLFTNLQLWRGLWIFQLVGNMAFLVACKRLMHDYRCRWLCFLTIAINVIEHFLGAVPIASTLSSICIGFLVYSKKNIQISWRYLVRWMIALLLALATVYLFLIMLVWFSKLNDGNALLHLTRLSLLVFLIFLIGHWVAAGANAIRSQLILSILVLFPASLTADVRTGEQIFLTSNLLVPRNVQKIVAEHSVYWEGGIEILWLKLNSPSYFSCLQGGGLMFYRSTAIEFVRRADLMRPLNSSDFDRFPNRHCPQKHPARASSGSNKAEISLVCQINPELDWIFLRHKVGRLAEFSFELPYRQIREQQHVAPRFLSDIKLDQSKIALFYAYNCKNIRNG